MPGDLGRAGDLDARVLAWDAPTRVFKWALVVLVVDAWLSNKLGAGLPAWHRCNGYAVLVLVVFRLFWGVVGGSTARFASFVTGPARVLAYVRAQFAARPLRSDHGGQGGQGGPGDHGGPRGRPPKYLGHNPLGGWMIVALLVFVAAQCLTGLYAADEDRLIIEGPLARTVTDAAVDFAARWHHRLFGGVEILAVLHIAANVFYTSVRREPLIPAMWTGAKPAQDFVDMPSARPGSWSRAALCLLAATALVFGAIAGAGGRIL